MFMQVSGAQNDLHEYLHACRVDVEVDGLSLALCLEVHKLCHEELCHRRRQRHPLQCAAGLMGCLFAFMLAAAEQGHDWSFWSFIATQLLLSSSSSSSSSRLSPDTQSVWKAGRKAGLEDSAWVELYLTG